MFECKSCGNTESFKIQKGTETKMKRDSKTGQFKRVTQRYDIGICSFCGATAADINEGKYRDNKKRMARETLPLSMWLDPFGKVFGAIEQGKDHLFDPVSGQTYRKAKCSKIK